MISKLYEFPINLILSRLKKLKEGSSQNYLITKENVVCDYKIENNAPTNKNTSYPSETSSAINQISYVDALLNLYEVTNERDYLEEAKKSADAFVKYFVEPSYRKESYQGSKVMRVATTIAGKDKIELTSDASYFVLGKGGVLRTINVGAVATVMPEMTMLVSIPNGEKLAKVLYIEKLRITDPSTSPAYSLPYQIIGDDSDNGVVGARLKREGFYKTPQRVSGWTNLDKKTYEQSSLRAAYTIAGRYSSVNDDYGTDNFYFNIKAYPLIEGTCGFLYYVDKYGAKRNSLNQKVGHIVGAQVGYGSDVFRVKSAPENAGDIRINQFNSESSPVESRFNTLKVACTFYTGKYAQRYSNFVAGSTIELCDWSHCQPDAKVIYTVYSAFRKLSVYCPTVSLYKKITHESARQLFKESAEVARSLYTEDIPFKTAPAALNSIESFAYRMPRLDISSYKYHRRYPHSPDANWANNIQKLSRNTSGVKVSHPAYIASGNWWTYSLLEGGAVPYYLNSGSQISLEISSISRNPGIINVHLALVPQSAIGTAEELDKVEYVKIPVPIYETIYGSKKILLDMNNLIFENREDMVSYLDLNTNKAYQSALPVIEGVPKTLRDIVFMGKTVPKRKMNWYSNRIVGANTFENSGGHKNKIKFCSNINVEGQIFSDFVLRRDFDNREGNRLSSQLLLPSYEIQPIFSGPSGSCQQCLFIEPSSYNFLDPNFLYQSLSYVDQSNGYQGAGQQKYGNYRFAYQNEFDVNERYRNPWFTEWTGLGKRQFLMTQDENVTYGASRWPVYGKLTYRGVNVRLIAGFNGTDSQTGESIYRFFEILLQDSPVEWKTVEISYKNFLSDPPLPGYPAYRIFNKDGISPKKGEPGGAPLEEGELPSVEVFDEYTVFRNNFFLNRMVIAPRSKPVNDAPIESWVEVYTVGNPEKMSLTEQYKIKDISISYETHNQSSLTIKDVSFINANLEDSVEPNRKYIPGIIGNKTFASKVLKDASFDEYYWKGEFSAHDQRALAWAYLGQRKQFANTVEFMVDSILSTLDLWQKQYFGNFYDFVTADEYSSKANGIGDSFFTNTFYFVKHKAHPPHCSGEFNKFLSSSGASGFSTPSAFFQFMNELFSIYRKIKEPEYSWFKAEYLSIYKKLKRAIFAVVVGVDWRVEKTKETISYACANTGSLNARYTGYYSSWGAGYGGIYTSENIENLVNTAPNIFSTNKSGSYATKESEQVKNNRTFFGSIEYLAATYHLPTFEYSSFVNGPEGPLYSGYFAEIMTEKYLHTSAAASQSYFQVPMKVWGGSYWNSGMEEGPAKDAAASKMLLLNLPIYLMSRPQVLSHLSAFQAQIILSKLWEDQDLSLILDEIFLKEEYERRQWADYMAYPGSLNPFYRFNYEFYLSVKPTLIESFQEGFRRNMLQEMLNTLRILVVDDESSELHGKMTDEHFPLSFMKDLVHPFNIKNTASLNSGLLDNPDRYYYFKNPELRFMSADRDTGESFHTQEYISEYIDAIYNAAICIEATNGSVKASQYAPQSESIEISLEAGGLLSEESDADDGTFDPIQFSVVSKI